tara:strand:- start:3509 stop:4741 length:1233 start_codon:yes stop_codon:yes gene_type:complete
MNDQIESTFQLPAELQDVPTNYSMSHITYEDVNGILSLVEIALQRGSIKGDELAILNQIRNDCMLEVQDYQTWVQKRQQIVAVEQQIANEQAKLKQQQEIESVKATSDAKVQAAQDASRILQNRINELENQAKARGITPVQSEHSEAELNVAMKPVNMGSPSKSWDNARAQNPVPVTTNQPPIVAPQSETSGTITANPELAEKIKETRVAFDDYGRTADLVEEDTISNQMQNAWENIEGENQGLDVSVNVPSPDEVEPLFQINLGQDGNAPLGDQVTEEDVNMNTTYMDMNDDFEPIQGDGEVEIELQEDPESVADVQVMKEAVEEEYEEVVIPNSMELQKMTKAKIKEVADSIGITVSDNQTKSAMIKDFEEESWNLIKEAEENENATVHQDEDIIRDGGYFGDDNDSK